MKIRAIIPLRRAAAAACLAGVAVAQPATAATASEAFAEGVQIYQCKAASVGYAWSLKAPEATLRDGSGAVIGRHFAGPSWQANDGSTVVGEPVNASPAPQPGNVPWIVLRAKSHEGTGVMADVAYIVRMHTHGGVSPADGCDAAHMGAEVRVPYTASYLFFADQGR